MLLIWFQVDTQREILAQNTHKCSWLPTSKQHLHKWQLIYCFLVVQILPYMVFYFDWFSIWVYLSWSDLVSVVHCPYEETTSLEKLFVANFSGITRIGLLWPVGLLWHFLVAKYNSPWNNSWNKRNNSKFCQIFPINYYWKTQHKYTGLQINILEPINACSLVSSTRIS